MNNIVELDTFRELLEKVESYSKVSEVAIAIDDSRADCVTNSHDSSSLHNLYGGVITELRKSAYEECEFDASIFLEISRGELEHESPKYVSVCLTNNNYTDAIVVQPEMNFDDYRNHKTFGIDFVSWSQLLNKTIKISQEVVDQLPIEYSLEEYALGHILWEVSFYGSSTTSPQTDVSRKIAMDVDLNSLIQLDIKE